LRDLARESSGAPRCFTRTSLAAAGSLPPGVRAQEPSPRSRTPIRPTVDGKRRVRRSKGSMVDRTARHGLQVVVTGSGRLKAAERNAWTGLTVVSSQRRWVDGSSLDEGNWGGGGWGVGGTGGGSEVDTRTEREARTIRRSSAGRGKWTGARRDGRSRFLAARRGGRRFVGPTSKLAVYTSDTSLLGWGPGATGAVAHRSPPARAQGARAEEAPPAPRSMHPAD